MKDYNASASVFGWHFQINAAIIFMLREIRNIDSIRIEGLDEDIELQLSNGAKIFIQAKSKATLGADNNALTKLSEGMKTLIHAASKNKYEKLYFVTNYPNPIGGRQSQYNSFMGGTYIERSFAEIPTGAKSSALTKIKEVEQKYSLKMDTDKLFISVIPFDGEIKDIRERVISAQLKEFLNGISVNEGSSKELLEIWQSDMFFNASNIDTKIELNKKKLMWPIVVLNCELSEDDKLLDEVEEELGLDSEDVEIILRRYGKFINKQIEHFDFVIKVISDFRNHKAVKRGRERKKEVFVNQNWSSYKKDIYSGDLTDELLETLIKIILLKLLNKQTMVTKVVKEVNL